MMRPFFILIVLMSILLGACSSSEQSLPKKLVLLHTTDEHSYLLGVGPESDDYLQRPGAGGALTGGIGRRKTLLDRERMAARAKGAGVLTVSSGDNMMGTLFHTGGSSLASDYRAMHAMGYDLGTFGNHDFELGPGYLADVIRSAVARNAMIPIVSSNIHFSDTPGDSTLKAMFDESGTDSSKPLHRNAVLATGNGLRVGFVGIMGNAAAKDAPGKTPTTFSLPAGCTEGDPCVMDRIYKDTQVQVDYLRNVAGVDVVVVLGHTGTDREKPEIGESQRIAQNVTGIDVILSGHTHLKTEAYTVKGKDGRPVVIQEPGRYGDHIGKLTLDILSSGEVRIDRDGTAMLPVNETIVPDPAMRPLVDEVIDTLERGDEWTGSDRSMLERTLSAIAGKPVIRTDVRGELYFRTLGSTAFDLPLALRRETGMLRLASDAMLAAAETTSGPTTAALTAGAVVRDGIYKGKTGAVSFADIFRIIPMGRAASATKGVYTPGNPLVRFACTASDLKLILEKATDMAYASMESADNLIIPSGLRFNYDPGRSSGDMVTKITLATDHADLDGSYTFTIYDTSVPDGPWLVDQATKYTIVTDYHLAEFASFIRVTLLDPDTAPDYVPFSMPAKAVMKRSDGSEYKDYEALAHYLVSTNGGAIPGRYNDRDPAGAGPKRAVCSGERCGQ